MNYLANTLLKNEKIIYLTHPCLVIFVLPTAIFIAAIWLYLFGWQIQELNLMIFQYHLYEMVTTICVLTSMFIFLKSYIAYACSEYGITNKRVLMKTGFIQINSFEIFLDKVEAVHVDQTIMGRIFNYGSLIIVGTGGSTDPFLNLPNPLKFRTMIQQQIDYELHSK